MAWLQHAFRSNANEFIHNGKVYVWNYWIFLGSKLNLTDKATGDVLAEVQLLPTWRWQIISSWSWRYVLQTWKMEAFEGTQLDCHCILVHYQLLQWDTIMMAVRLR